MFADRLRRVLGAEDGATTVDWVVLTAAVATLAVAVVPGIFGGVVEVAQGIAGFLSGLEVGD